MSYQKEREEFITTMIAEGLTLPEARLILRHAATLQRLAVTACNVELTPRQKKQEARAQAGIGAICQASLEHTIERAGIVPNFSGDPRGAVVKLRVPSGRTNDWGQTGVCVPTLRY